MIYDAVKKGAQWTVEVAKTHRKSGTAVVAMGTTALANAAGTGPDLTPLTSAIDFSTIVTAILAIFAAAIVVDLAWKGGKYVVKAIRGA